LLHHKGHPESAKLSTKDTNAKPDLYHRRSVNLLQATPQVLAPFEAFCQAALLDDPFEAQRRQGSYALVGTYLYCIPDNLPNLDKIRVIHPGWWLGTVKTPMRGDEWRFEPSHALAMGMKASQVRHAVHLQVGEPPLLAYLRGEPLESEGEDGWVLVTVEGYSLGWAKRTKGKLKNGYPRGLRWS
jgi:NOL1/NOP2/fmu family ribosome biogenesis protein